VLEQPLEIDYLKEYAEHRLLLMVAAWRIAFGFICLCCTWRQAVGP
jgi:hypothetical protein